ncbi:MAG: hypothetical protein QOI38_1373 [Sphingomonadales bacterium]|jgi:predicted lipid-binding transport protein (Tim44 family)|nr:hypothetical protein [Sphingomonadales bacterium]
MNHVLRCGTAAIALTLGGACTAEQPAGSANRASVARAAAPPAAPQENLAAADTAPAAPANDLAGARALIARIYSSYAGGGGPDLEGLFTPELRAAIARDSEMEDGGLSYDPFCQCQDFEDFSHRIESVEPDGDGAVARVAMSNMGQARTLVIRLVRRGGSWLVADVHNGESGLLNGN